MSISLQVVLCIFYKCFILIVIDILVCMYQGEWVPCSCVGTHHWLVSGTFIWEQICCALDQDVPGLACFGENKCTLCFCVPCASYSTNMGSSCPMVCASPGYHITLLLFLFFSVCSSECRWAVIMELYLLCLWLCFDWSALAQHLPPVSCVYLNKYFVDLKNFYVYIL